MTALTALAAATIAPPEGVAPSPVIEAAIREACAGAWRAIEVVLAGDVLRGRLGKTRDAIVRDAVEAILALRGNVGIRADALAALRAARDAGALDGALELDAVIADIRVQGTVVVGRAAVAAVRKHLAGYRDLEVVLEGDVATLLVDAARAIFRTRARDPELARWAIGPTGSPARDRALSAFAELATSPASLDELETLIAVPIALDDNVQFTVYRPRSIDPGRWHQLLAFAHLADRRPGEDDLPDPVEEVKRQAAQVLGDKARHYAPLVQDSGAAIPAEGELTFVPEFAGIEVNPPRRSFLWLETVHREEFRIRAGRELDGKTVRGRVTVFLGSIAIAEVACAVHVDASRPEPKREPTSVRAYRKIFASYSHRDLEVVNQFETYARALGDEYLRDWVHLRTGEVWTDRLCQLIEQADAFQLFWSRNSMRSQFVRQEYEHALSLNRPSFVRPTYWEDPMPTAPGLPPESLLRLHFQKLGRAVVDAAGRSNPSERDDTNVDRLAVVDARKEADTTDLDVTDPQYSLPEMPAADASSSMPAAPPSARRYSASEAYDEEAPSTIEPARVERESRKREARSVTTEPGIGTVKPALKAMVSPPSPAKASPITAPGVAPAEPRKPETPAAPSTPAPPPPMPAPAARPPAMPRPASPSSASVPAAMQSPAMPSSSASVPAAMQSPASPSIVSPPRPAAELAAAPISYAQQPPAAPLPTPTTTPDVAPSNIGAVAASPWSREGSSHNTPVSPFAPTVPVAVFVPGPDAFAPAPEPFHSSAPKEAAPSKLPFVLITIGVLALLAVFLVWLFN